MFCLIIFFSFKVREGLYNGIQRASKNSGIKAVVIIGKGRTFPSGADITEFGKPPKGIRISSLIMPFIDYELCKKCLHYKELDKALNLS